MPGPRQVEADQDAADADQTSADADQTSADSDQIGADEDQIAAERDEADAGSDQLASEADQARADELLSPNADEAELAAYLDDLTGAFRRDMGWLALTHEIARAQRGDRRFVIGFVERRRPQAHQ